MRWIVGDIQGCARELDRLLESIRFNPARDELWSAGDLINRGPDSLQVLRTWTSIAGKGVIGNHEVDALLAFSGARKKRLPALRELFAASDAVGLMIALRALPVLKHLPSGGKGPDVWLVHAGLSPAWTRIQDVAAMINEEPHDDDWLRSEAVDYATNVRCCTPDGRRSGHLGPPDECEPPFQPWDEFYRGETLVVHGHWARRGFYRGDLTMGLDSGCVYGGDLTAWCQDEDVVFRVPAAR